MKKFLLTSTYFILSVFIIVILIFVFFLKFLSPQFSDYYQSEIETKIDRIEKVKGKKIIYISGSSGAFCVDSKKISEELGVEFINLGLHAGFGHYYIDSIAKKYAKKGDIVIISHELDTYYNDYYSSNSNISLIATSINDNISYLKYFSLSEKKDFIYYLPAYIFTKLNKILYKDPDMTGVYSRYAFNEYGDIGLNLKFKKDNSLYHPINKYSTNFSNNTIIETKNMIEKMKQKNIEVFLNFPYMRVKNIKTVNYDNVKKINDFMSNKLNVDILISLDESIKNGRYFYDTANHCSSWGKKEYTNFLIKKLKEKVVEDNL